MTFICSKKNNAILIETFIFDFNQNIYGKKMQVIPLKFIKIESIFFSIKIFAIKSADLSLILIKIFTEKRSKLFLSNLLEKKKTLKI